jgi:hypothetical protein
LAPKIDSTLKGMHVHRADIEQASPRSALLGALTIGMVLLFVYQVSIELFVNAYDDDSTNYFFSREYFERFTPLIVLLGAALGWAISNRMNNQYKVPFVIVSVCLTGTALISQHYLGFAATTNQWTQNFFGGFGTKVTVTALVIAVLWAMQIISLPSQLSEFDAIRLINLFAFFVIMIFYLPASVVTSQSIFHSDFTYVLNELLGPVSGHPPLLESAPQYSALLGWPLKAFSWIPLSALIELSVLYVSLLFFLIVILIALILKGVFQKLPFATLIFIPISILLARPSGRTSGSFIMFPSAIVRNFFPILLICLLYFSVRRNSLVLASVLGITASLSAFNNLEFGLICTLAVTLSVAVGFISKILPLHFVAYYLTSLIVGSAFLIVSLGLGEDDWNRYKFFATAYGGGNNNIPMPVFGLHSLTMAIAATTVIVGIVDTFRCQKHADSSIQQLTPSSCLLSLTAGLAGCGFHLYYTGRSMVSTQLQTEFPTLIICAACLIWRFNLTKGPSSSFIGRFESIPILMIALLPVASLWLGPDPSIEASRLRGRLPESEYGSVKLGLLQIELSDFSGFLRQSKSEFANAKIGFIADHNGNALSLIHHLENLLPFNDMNDVTDIVSTSQRDVCKTIAESQVDYVAIEKYDESIESYNFIIDCPTVSHTPVLQSPFGILLRSKVPSAP